MSFTYSAKSRTGERVEGVVDASDKLSAVRAVENLGLVPISIRQNTEQRAEGDAFFARSSPLLAPRVRPAAPVILRSGDDKTPALPVRSDSDCAERSRSAGRRTWIGLLGIGLVLLLEVLLAWALGWRNGRPRTATCFWGRLGGLLAVAGMGIAVCRSAGKWAACRLATRAHLRGRPWRSGAMECVAVIVGHLLQFPITLGCLSFLLAAAGSSDGLLKPRGAWQGSLTWLSLLFLLLMTCNGLIRPIANGLCLVEPNCGDGTPDRSRKAIRMLLRAAQMLLAFVSGAVLGGLGWCIAADAGGTPALMTGLAVGACGGAAVSGMLGAGVARAIVGGVYGAALGMGAGLGVSLPFFANKTEYALQNGSNAGMMALILLGMGLGAFFGGWWGHQDGVWAMLQSGKDRLLGLVRARAATAWARLRAACLSLRGPRLKMAVVLLCALLTVLLIGGASARGLWYGWVGDYKEVNTALMAVVVKGDFTFASTAGKPWVLQEGVVKKLTVLGKPVAMANGKFKIAGPSSEFYIRTKKYGKFKFTNPKIPEMGFKSFGRGELKTKKTDFDMSSNLQLWLTDTQKKALMAQTAH